MWIETESNKLAMPGTYSRNEKAENFMYFQDLFKNIIPAQTETTSDKTQGKAIQQQR